MSPTLRRPPSSFGNGNVNGNGHYIENAAPVETPLLPVREMRQHAFTCSSRIFSFSWKINETARKLRIKLAFVKNDPETLAKIIEGPEEERPSLIVFDLNNAAAKPMTLIPKIKSS